MRIALALLVAVIAAGCGSSDEQAASPQPTTTNSETVPSTPTRDAAPPLSGESLAGEPITLGDFRGRPVMINVWSSW
jgi:ABC-type Fe3+-hydroxamate transport system substrate-binding protein